MVMNMNKIQRLSITLMTLLMTTTSWAYKVTFNDDSDISITATFKSSGDAITPGSTEVTAGQTVVLTVAENGNKYLQTLKIDTDVDAGSATSRRSIGIQGNIGATQTGPFTYEFVMPIGNVTITPTFADRMDISSGTYVATINLAEPSHVFDWLAHTPVISSVISNSAPLTEGTDYTVDGIDAQTNAGSYPITITGIGKYKGTKQVTYSITQRDISGASVQFSPTSFVYNHQNQAPLANTVEVYLQGQHLTLDTDYNNVNIPTSQNAGSYDISVTGIGNFIGTASSTYTITKMPISNCTFTGSTSFTYNGDVQTPTITLNDGVGNLTENTHYTITYSTHEEEQPETNASKDVGSYTMTITAEDGTNYSGSKEITYSINSAGFAITAIADQTYTGAEIRPTVEVKDGINVLTFGTHYDVVYSNNINVGPARVSVVGLNSYNGKFGEVTFNITPKSVSGLTITLSQNSFTYNASTQKPTVTVKDGTTTLVENKDYTLSNPGAINAGTYHVSIKGIGNYTGDKTSSSTYTINELSLTGAEITLLTDEVTYDGTAQTPPIKQVKIGDVVIPSSDYDLVWANNEDAAAYDDASAPPTVTVKAKTLGTINLSDSETKKFTIERKSIANVKITLDPASFTYKNGVTQKPTTVTVEDLEREVTLDLGTDYTLTNNGGEAAGTYDVTVTGIKNYTGTAKKYYTISEQAGTTAITVADIDDQEYTGGAIKPTPTVTYQYDTDPSHTVTLTNDTHYTLSYENNVNVGPATVIVTLKGGYTGSTTKTFNIVKKSLSGATVTPSPASFTYNGNVQKPTFSVVKDSRTLAEGVDYEVTYSGDAISAGTQNVTINGIGNYKDTKAATYTINKLSLETAVITLPATRFEYSRGAQTPTPQVKVGSLVISSDDYDVSYDDDNNTSTTADVTNIGQKTVYVTGKNNCDGSKTTTYEIVAKQIDANMVTLNHSVMTYTGSPLDPGVVVKDGEATLVVGTNTEPHEYKVELTNNTKVGTATVTVEGQGNYTGKVQKTFTIQENVHGAFTIAAIDPVTYDGTAHQPTPNVKYSGTDLTLNTDYTLSYINNVNAGTAIVTVTGKGGYQGSTGTKEFTINPKTLTSAMVTLSNFTVTDQTPNGFTYNGNNQKPNVTITDAAAPIIADDYDITNAGGVDASIYSVSITGKRNYTGTVNLTYKIYPMSITTAEVALSYNNIVYNGVAQKPTVRSVYANGHLLTSTTDYTLSWPDADYTNHGTKNVTVTGTGNYKDSRTVQYTIDKKPLVSDMIKITNQNLTYTGSNQTPEVTIEDKNGTTNIIKAADYTLLNPAHSAVGNYEVTLTATDAGNYSGEVTKQYSIVTAGSTGFTVVTIDDQDYTGLALTPALTVYKAGTTSPALVLGTDYTAEYSNNINAGTATVTVTGKGNYSGTQTVYFTVTPKSLNAAGITVTLSSTSFSYTGATQKPEVTVKDGDSKTLVLNTDYTLVNDGGIANGTYTVTITGQGNYKDVVTPSYTIGGQSLEGAVVILNRLDSYVYDGTEKTPGVSEVKVGSTVIPASNYTVSYADNVNAGTATVTVTGTGNCSGIATATFDITPKTVNSDMITISPTTFNYDGAQHKPTTVTVMDGETLMVEGTTTNPKDYLLSNPGGTEIGVYSVTITGQGNYTGTASKSYTIVANDASGFSINAIAAVTYNGAAQEPVPVVKEGDNTLSSTYYSVAYLNNINAGTAVVTVTGKNGYTFVKSQTFTILPKSLTDGMLTSSATNFIYNGNVQKPTLTITDKNASDVSIITSNDYVITNEGGADVGTYHVVVNGQNNYTGSIDKTFTISQLSLSTATITLATLSSYVYDGGAKTPAVQLVKVGELVVPATAYDVEYSSNVNVGTATVTVAAKTGTNFKDGNTTTFNIEQKEVNSNMIALGGTGFNTTTNSFTYDGSLHIPTVSVTDGTTPMVLDTDYTLTNAGGTDVGNNYSVTIEGKGNYKGSATKQYSIVTATTAVFTVGAIADQTYTGYALTPKPEVTDGDKVLVENTDYTLSYTNNVYAGTNTASVTVTGKGNYSGTKTQNFTILPKALDESKISLSYTTVTYTGTELKPIVTVLDDNTELTLNTDYTVTYPADVTSQGTKTLTITGIRNYTGTFTKTYTIGKVDITGVSITLESLTQTYNGLEQKPRVLVVALDSKIIPATGYSVSYSNNTNAGTATVTVTGTGNYEGAPTTSFIINPKAVTSSMITLSQENFTYTGELQKPGVTISDKMGDSEIITTADYTLTNDGGTEVGNYEVKIVGKRNYTGTATKQYSIVAKQSGTAFDIVAIGNQTYTGSPITPTVTVNKAGTTTALNPGTDYDVAYSDNVNVGTATVTVTGKGNYASTKTTTFNITAKSLTADMVTLSTPTTFTYNGNIQKPTVTVSDGNAMTSLDYTISNSDHSDVGTYDITVTGTHNYTGSVTKQYTISPLSITGASVTLEALTYTYNGTAQKPAVSEVKVGTLTVPSTDYDITYPTDATSHGQKTITITAQHNFTGTVTKDYTISPKPVTSDMIILSNSNLAYTGTLLTPDVTVKDGENTLIQGDAKDYTLVNEGAVNVGTYSVSITGHGNYGGQASKEYNIIATGSAGFTIDDIDDVTYNGTTQEPTVVVRDANNPDVVLTKDTHYTINFTNNTNVGTASANVTGKGNYQGTATKTFKINPKTLTADMVQVTGYTLPTGDGFIYNGAIQKPAVMVADGSAMTADDYVVVNNGGLNVNETSSPYEITITGSNNYTGTVTKTFSIQPLSIEDAAITLYQLPDKAYDGTEKKPGVREVVTAANIVVPTVGYDVAYGNNINAGTATVTVTGKNNFTGTASTTFEIEKKAVNSSMITLSQENFNYTGELQKPTVTISDKNGDTERITADDYTLTNDGGIEVGDYKVKIVGKRNYKGEAEKQYSIWEKDAVINHFTITLGEASVEYDGTEKKPSVTVKDGDKKLEAETDYTVVFSDNTNAGTATVTVTGKGNYTGTRNTTFEITKKPLTAAMITVSGYTTADGFIYNGKNQTPTVVVRDGTALKASDYVITNNGGVNQGTYHAIVTATGNYSGEFDYPYVIAKRSIEGAKVTLYELESYVYDGKAKKPGVKEVAFGEDVIPTAGYAVAYSNNTDAGTASVTVTGQGNYTGTLTTEFTIERQSLTADMIILSNEEYVYNDATQKPVVVLMNGGTEMVLDTDYTLTNEGGVSVGVYDVIANGKGNYNGMATKQFSIISKGIGSFDVTLSTEQVVYTGSEHRPTVTVKDGDKTLTPGSEFSVSYTDNTNAGTATVTITGQGEYSGTTTKTFIIKPKPLTEDMVFLSSTSYIYNTLQQKPTVTVSDQSFLTANDYTLTNDGGINHGDYDVVVIGRNNYTGVITKQFTIKPLSIETAKVVLYEMASYVYDGTAKNPDVREVAISSTIVPTSSYTVEISPNVNVGTVTVTVTGKENFTGTASTTFEITPKPITDNMMILSEEVFYYNGELQRPDVEVKDGENTLVEETDYTIVNEGGTEVGSYEVKVTGLGNYTSEVIKTYVIERSDFSVDITATDEEQKEFAASLIVSLIDEENNNIRVKGVKIPESEKDKEIDLTIPATCTVDEVTYTITEIAAYAFEDAEHLQNLYLPDTEETLTIGDNAIPATTTIHTSLALLDDYALMPSLGANFRNDKVMTTVKAKNQYWTFSSSVDVYVPENITVFTVQERTTTTVAIVELTSTELNVSGVSVIKSNNGVLLSGNSDTLYDIVACPRRMSSGTFISTDDHKDYGEENCLEPVIEATHYENDYYILKDNKFCSIKLEDEAVKVPAGKAVLHLPAAAQGRSYSTVLDVINEGTTSVSEEVKVNSEKFATADWYDLNGRKIEGRPVKKGVYIVNGKKVVIK